MNYIDVLGFSGATLTTVSFIPQVFKIVKTKDTCSISLIMYIIFAIGLMFWEIYGILNAAAPIIIANLVTLGLVSIILVYKIKYK